MPIHVEPSLIIEAAGLPRRKIKLEAVSFEDLNFSSFWRRTAAETFYRIAEPLWWRPPCLCCPASHHRARCLHRIPTRLPRFVPCRVGAADRQPTQAHIDPDRPRTRCSREHAEEAVRPNRSGSDQAADSDTRPSTWRLRRKHGLTDEYY